MGLTYRSAGVDIDAGERLVDRIRPMAARTKIPEVLGGVGGFAGLCAVPAGLSDPVMVSGTDGVGTKLRIAFATGCHDTVGIDLVAMCVNDVLTVGARPLFFLDYFATGALDVDVATEVIRGIAKGCELAECALLGGETAEMPDSYPAGEYDLAGFSVGVVERAKILDGSQTRAGDRLLALPSSGVHSNGFSLARKALFERAGYDVNTVLPALGAPLGEVLLTPTRIYVKAIRALLERVAPRAMCHVTGGGLPGNLPRVFPDGLGAEVTELADRPLIFEQIQRAGEVSLEEMRRAFNLGVGFVIAVAPSDVEEAQLILRNAGESPFELGTVIEMPGAVGEARVKYARP